MMLLFSNKRNRMMLFLMLCILGLGRFKSETPDSEDNLPTICHVCKHTVAEFLEELDNSAKTKAVLQLGHVFQSDKPKTVVYHKSNLRLIEALENTCEKIADYKVHKDKPNSLRYAKGESSTFTTLKNLKKRGVQVDLGFPDEMWDTPDAEVVELKKQCENTLEKHEEEINDWYFNHQEQDLYDWFCRDNFLKGEDNACLETPDSSDESTGNGKSKMGKNKDEDDLLNNDNVLENIEDRKGKSLKNGQDIKKERKKNKLSNAKERDNDAGKNKQKNVKNKKNENMKEEIPQEENEVDNQDIPHSEL